VSQTHMKSIPGVPTRVKKLSRSDLPERRLRRAAAFLILYLLFQAEVGLAWDRNWHDYLGRNGFWIPPHLMSYSGIGGAGVVALSMVLIETTRYRQGCAGVNADSTVRVFRFFSAPLGFVLIGFGTLIDLAAAPLDNYWHLLYGIDVTLWTPFHLMGLAGSILAGIGLLYALASEAAIERQWEERSLQPLGLNGPQWAAIAFFAVLIELAFIGLTAFKPVLLGPVSVITYPLALVLVAGLCLVSAVQLTRKAGAASLVALFLCVLAWMIQLFVPWALHESSAFFGLPFRGGQEPVFNVMFVILPFLFLLCALLVDGAFYWQCRTQGAKDRLRGAWKLGALMALPTVCIPSWATLALLHLAPHTPLPPDISQAFLLDTTWPAMLLILPFALILGAGMAALGSALGDSCYWCTC
jgi:hypothetical protein